MTQSPHAPFRRLTAELVDPKLAHLLDVEQAASRQVDRAIAEAMDLAAMRPLLVAQNRAIGDLVRYQTGGHSPV